ncbi:MAG: response regulator transcription factor [Saprospiraceae bacterium]|nr:response regulator transcription factor [Saprospiraceae bacterium]
MKRLLVVEDEESLRETLALNLELEGYEVVTATSGGQALELLGHQRFDLVLLDVMLPGMSGMEVCAAIRLADRHIPVLMLTARGAPEDRIEGLRTGADDYLVKPFHLEELLIRIGNLLRRQDMGKPEDRTLSIVRFGSNTVDFQRLEAMTAKGAVSLTRKEWALLRLLVDREGEVVSRQQILQIVWGYDVIPSTRTIDNFILNFRKYFEADAREPRHFLSIRGVGYRFVA